MSSTPYTLQSLEQAIAQMENGPVPTNPGDLEEGNQGFGTYSAAGGQQITVFGTLQQGWNALQNLLQNAISGQSKYYNATESLSNFEQTYTGNPNAGNTLANILGIPSSTPLNSFGNVVNQNPTTLPGQSSSSTTAPQTSTANSLGSNPTMAQVVEGFLNDLLGPSFFGKTIGPSNVNQATQGAPGIVDVVVVVVGLILIAGAIFGFKNLTTTVIEGAKKGAEIAAA
jgi:hypothetical protein